VLLGQKPFVLGSDVTSPLGLVDKRSVPARGPALRVLLADIPARPRARGACGSVVLLQDHDGFCVRDTSKGLLCVCVCVSACVRACVRACVSCSYLEHGVAGLGLGLTRLLSVKPIYIDIERVDCREWGVGWRVESGGWRVEGEGNLDDCKEGLAVLSVAEASNSSATCAVEEVHVRWQLAHLSGVWGWVEGFRLGLKGLG
jgi:hypothetical protein